MIPVIKLAALSVAAVGFFLAGHFYGSMSPPDAHSIVERTIAAKHANMFKDLVRNSVFDQFLKTSDLDSLEKAANLAQSWPAANTLTRELLVERQNYVQELKRLVLQVIEQSKSSLTDRKYSRARKTLDLLRDSMTISHDRLEDALFAATGQWDADAAPVGKPDAESFQGVDARAAPMSPNGEIIVDVQPGPFGMHVKRGSTTVSEVFPGSAAQRAGINIGCKIVSIAGVPVSAGSWLQIFQKQRIKNKQGFKIQLHCPGPDARYRMTTTADWTKAKQGPGKKKKDDPHRKHVMMFKKPFGMNIQVFKLPRVVEVLPGYPAEKAGVKKGYVLIEVQDKPVDAQTFSNAIDACKPPCLLAFDTDVPLHEGNPFFGDFANTSLDQHMQQHLDIHNTAHYKEVKFEVTALPFGAHIRALFGGLPVVEQLTPGFSAEKLGVQVGDILTEVAGRAVNGSTWFPAFQMASPPFGVRFKRGLDHIAPESAVVELPGGFPMPPHV